MPVTGLVERIMDKNYQICLIYPEGDYESLPGCRAVGDHPGARLRTGRLHWLIIDEAHHVLPSNWAPSSPELARQLSSTILIRVHPGHVSPAALSGVNIVVVLVAEPQVMLVEFARAIEREPPNIPPHDSSGGEAWVWFCEENRLNQVRLEPSRSEHHRHKRKHVEGELGT